MMKNSFIPSVLLISENMKENHPQSLKILYLSPFAEGGFSCDSLEGVTGWGTPQTMLRVLITLTASLFS